MSVPPPLFFVVVAIFEHSCNDIPTSDVKYLPKKDNSYNNKKIEMKLFCFS